ncbi:hypothetical protein B0H13DRAFT_1903897 [Mycena leptocephala]|nr:hypothetical protein B0H13DRAFT_1903897 [Mycena leptocephala]
MGGFVSKRGHHPITTMKQLRQPIIGGEYLRHIRNLEVEDIMDKSKGDALAIPLDSVQGIALAQGLWFTTQCLARVHQRLPVTEVEVATLAFAVVNVFIWLLWWNKPFDVEHPVHIGRDLPPDEEAETAPLSLMLSLLGALTGHYSDNDDSDTISFTSASSNAVPSYWSQGSMGKATDFTFGVSVITEALVGVIFGAIHCTAWNTHFPSVAEMWMWKPSSLSVAAIPAAMVFLPLARSLFLCISPGLYERYRSSSMYIFERRIIFSYILARLFLITLPFTTLRALSPGAFIDVEWSVYLPHL